MGIVDPEPERPWPNNYGIWVDEIQQVELQDCLAHRWSRARVKLDEDRAHLIERAYGQVDNQRLKAALLGRCAKVTHIRGCAVRASHAGNYTTVELRGERPLKARLVMDATGHNPALLELAPMHSPPAQVAFGVALRLDAHPFPPDEMLFMDFSESGLSDDPSPQAPSFLYGMPFGPNSLFLQETSLVADPPASIDWLEKRLDARLKRLGLSRNQPTFVERCYIPMGLPIPRPQRVIGLGAAARLVHPATGYMLGPALRLATKIAGASKAALDAKALGMEAANHVWQSVWPEERRQIVALHQLGLSALLDLDSAQTRDFFDLFFKGPRGRDYLDLLAPKSAVVRAMLSVFLRSNPQTKLRLAKHGFWALMNVR